MMPSNVSELKTASLDEQKRAVFAQTLRQMRARVQLFLSLPLEALDRMAIENKMRAIGRDPL